MIFFNNYCYIDKISTQNFLEQLNKYMCHRSIILCRTLEYELNLVTQTCQDGTLHKRHNLEG